MVRANVSQRWPLAARELAQVMADPAQFAEMFPKSQPGDWSDFTDAYSKQPRIAAMIEEAAQVEAAKLLRQNPHVPAAAGLNVTGQPRQPAARRDLYNRRAPGAAVDSLAQSETALADIVMAVAVAGGRGSLDTIEAMGLRESMQNAMSERVPGQGGFLLPEVLRSQILAAALEQSIVRPRAHVVPMDSLRVPFPVIDDTSHVSSVFGGLTGYWTEEAAALTASQPGFGRTVLEAHKLTVYTTIPNELVHDSPLVMDFLQETLPATLAFYEDVAFINGSGTGQPQGYINAPAAIQVTRNTSSKVLFPDIANMYIRMLPVGMQNAVWVCSPNVIGQLIQLVATGVGQVENSGTLVSANAPVAPPLWLTNGSVAQGAEYTLLGHPLFVTEKAPALGSTGDLAFVNFSYYLLGDRQTMSLNTSEHYQFANDLLAVRLISRVEGRVWIQSAITPENGDSTLSPVVLLH